MLLSFLGLTSLDRLLIYYPWHLLQWYVCMPNQIKSNNIYCISLFLLLIFLQRYSIHPAPPPLVTKYTDIIIIAPSSYRCLTFQIVIEMAKCQSIDFSQQNFKGDVSVVRKYCLELHVSYIVCILHVHYIIFNCPIK